MEIRLSASILALIASIAACLPAAASPPEAAHALYREHCASCHGHRRYGGYAPPLIPDTLSRRSDAELLETIGAGLPNTQMPGFGHLLDAQRTRALIELLRESPGQVRWSADDIRASRIENPLAAGALAESVRRENLILVVERGTGDVSILDAGTLSELDRFPVGRIHGGLKFDRQIRKVLAATRDGTLVEYDLIRGEVRRKLKVGINTRNVALSPDGEFTAVANQLPQSAVLLDSRLDPVYSFALPGQPSAVYSVPGGRRFLLALRDVPRLYWIDYPKVSVESVEVPEPFEDFVLVPGSQRVVASSRGGSLLHLYDLTTQEVLASLPTRGLPHLFSACFFPRNGTLHAAFNHVGEARLSIVDMETFQVVANIPLVGSGYFARTHSGTPYLWIDTNTDAIQLVEKHSLASIGDLLVPEKGKTAMHIEFSADGDRAFVSVWHDDGAVVVYDSSGLDEIARLPYSMPVGKYNAKNKSRLLD